VGYENGPPGSAKAFTGSGFVQKVEINAGMSRATLGYQPVPISSMKPGGIVTIPSTISESFRDRLQPSAIPVLESDADAGFRR